MSRKPRFWNWPADAARANLAPGEGMGVSEEPKSAEAPKPVAAEPQAVRIVPPLPISERISLGALITAVIASIVGVLQTGFMWIARNDEVEAALRSEQIRACAAYRIAALNLFARAQWLAVDQGGPMARDEDFGPLSETYSNSLAQLAYLLPTGAEPTIALAESESMTAWGAYIERDYSVLRDVSATDGAWSAANAELLDMCHAVIRDVRDN